ncbi:MAG: 16S rRNA (cytosine(967)-C(5))-methyltransferase RsmB [Gammaproteobacteria bacterium]
MSVGNIRADAARLMAALQQNKHSLFLLLEPHRERSDYSLLQEIAFGCCRWYQQLDFQLSLLLEKPLKTKDQDIHCLLIVGLYQLRFLSIPEHAVLNETVNATQTLNKPWARGLVNAVLRNYVRRRGELETQTQQASGDVVFSHPLWLVENIRQQWPDQAEAILRANNERPPLTLRVNRRRVSRDDYLEILAEGGISARAGQLADTALYLDQAMPVSSIPGFAQGQVSVQDEASQLVSGLLAIGPGMRVLDACAAPGGKTSALLESEDSLTSCMAVDRDSTRMALLAQNLTRLGLEASIRVADALEIKDWWDGIEFDRILVDAPCTAVGVIRRHPDIKLLRQESSLQSQPQLQGQLLTRLWPTLAPGGLLLYTTCSVLRQENEQVIEAFLTATDNVKYESIEVQWGVECKYGRQLLPAQGIGTDGFYFCLLRKT